MATDKLKIVFIHQDGLITGSAISLRNMIDGLIKLKHEIIVIIPKIGEAIKIWENCGAKVHVFPFTTFWTSPGPRCMGRNQLKQLTALMPSPKLRRFILSFNPDIVHINDKAALQAGISLKATRIPIIQHSRSAYHLTACKINAMLSANAIKKYASQIICISEDEVQGFEKYHAKTILYNSVDLTKAEEARMLKEQTRKKLGIRKDDIVIGMAENFSVHKGLIELTQIAKNVINNNSKHSIKFLLVGNINTDDKIKFDGSTEVSSFTFLQEFLNKNNMQNHFIFAGFQKNPLEYIAAMDILIVSKAHGVLGRQPIEAQAVGTAVVAINGHSKNSKIVINDIGGYLVNSISELTSKLTEILRVSEKLDELGINGRNYAISNFDSDQYAQTLVSIYNKMKE